MGMYKRSDMYFTEWWYESLCAWDNSIKESWQNHKVWACLNDSRKAPLENHDKMKANHQPGVYLVIGDDHTNQWRSINLNWKGNMSQYGIRCVVSRQIKWHQIIHHQVCNLSHPCPQLNQIHISKGISQKKKHEDIWCDSW